MKKLSMIILSLVLSGCAGLPLTTGDLFKSGSPLDYVRLFDIAMQLAKDDRQANIDGLLDLSNYANAGDSGQHLVDFLDETVNWVDATKLAWKAAKAIVNGIKSRDVKVNEVISIYEHGAYNQQPTQC